MNIVCSVFVCSLTMLLTACFRLPQDFSRCVGKYSRLKGNKHIVTNIEEVQISCQEENLKTAPSMFISCCCLNVNVASFLYYRQVPRCFCAFF